jgi:hypothetical protein
MPPGFTKELAGENKEINMEISRSFAPGKYSFFSGVYYCYSSSHLMHRVVSGTAKSLASVVLPVAR